MNIFAFVIGLVVVVLTMVFAFLLVIINESKKPRNKVRFFVARDMDGMLCLYISKPLRSKIQFHPNICNGVIVLNRYNYKRLGLNEDDYVNLKWEDEPVEVFINLED